jgi:GDPmannose 4,6-dehydratase
MSKKALITGVNGQTGSYLAELLLGKDYNVIGMIRRASTNNTKERLGLVLNNKNFRLIEGDITDLSCVNDIICSEKPDEVYNLAAQSHVATSFKQPAATWQINAIGPQNILEAIRKYSSNTRYLQASTSEMYGSVIDQDGFQRETTELSPNSPYAISKVAAHHCVRLYREAYNLFACSSICFNHESPRRGEQFVTRKITKYIKSLEEHINMGRFVTNTPEELNDWVLSYVSPLKLGNLDAKRDWGFAGDYVYAMWLMLQQNKPDDFVIATGETHSVREFLDEAFNYIGIVDWSRFVEIDPEFIRPFEVPVLCGDASKAREKLGWTPTFKFKDLVRLMIDNEKNN